MTWVQRSQQRVIDILRLPQIDLERQHANQVHDVVKFGEKFKTTRIGRQGIAYPFQPFPQIESQPRFIELKIVPASLLQKRTETSQIERALHDQPPQVPR